MKFEGYINESSLSRIWKHAKNHISGTISAFRYAEDCGEGDIYTIKQNRKRNAILKAKLLTKGYSVTSIKGSYTENYGSKNEKDVDEESFFVVDINDTNNLKKDLMKFGEMFEQDSITYADKNGEYYLIGTNKCPNSYPGYKKESKEGKGIYGEKGKFFSKIGGRPFVFKSIDNKTNVLKEYSIPEIRSIEKLSEQGEK
jgi:hypothetical protein